MSFHDSVAVELEVFFRLDTAALDGYQADVGERGGRFSAGEQQLIALARVFLVDPSVIVLDEATSVIDIPSERAVQNALRAVLRGEPHWSSLTRHQRSSSPIACWSWLTAASSRTAPQPNSTSERDLLAQGNHKHRADQHQHRSSAGGSRSAASTTPSMIESMNSSSTTCCMKNAR